MATNSSDAGTGAGRQPSGGGGAPPLRWGQALIGHRRRSSDGLPANEVQLLSEAAAGEPGAVGWLLDEVAPIVYGFIFARVAGDEGVAQDLLQETLLEAVRGASSFRGEAAASTWMCAIARRRLSRHYEAERRAELARSSLRLVESVGRRTSGVSEDFELQDEVVRALAHLPVLQRQVLVLKYIEDLSVQEIAQEVGRSRVQVQSLLQRGRDSLKRQFGGPDGRY